MYEWEFWAGFFAVGEAILGGYVAAVFAHLILSYLITREGRGVLMTGTGMSRAYYLQLGVCWMVAGAVGSAVTLQVFPDMPMAVVSLATVAGMLCLSLVRLRNKVPHQQTLGDTLLLLLCVLVGFGVPACLRLI